MLSFPAQVILAAVPFRCGECGRPRERRLRLPRYRRAHGIRRGEVRFDETGEPSRIRSVVIQTGTICANGITLAEADHSVILIDSADGTVHAGRS